MLILLLMVVPASAAGTTEITVTKLANDGVTVLNETTVDYIWMEANLPVYGDGVTHYYHQGPVFIDYPDPEIEAALRWNPDEDINCYGYFDKDMGAVKGTNAVDLLNLVGGMNAGEEAKFIARDGWSDTLSYDNIYQYSDREGPIVLAWWRPDLGYVSEAYVEGIRMVWFADTSTNPWGVHIFGAWDWHEAADENYWYYYYQYDSQTQTVEAYPTTTGLSGKYIDQITIYSDDPVPELTSIAVTPADATVEIGSTQQYAATGYDQSGHVMEDLTFTWASSDPSVGPIGTDGLFSAAAAGSSTITATSGGISGSTLVTVPLPPPVLTEIIVSPATASVSLGDTSTFTATAYDQYGDTMTGVDIIWSSSNETVGTITPAGLFTALAVGETTLAASASGISGTAAVTVPLPPPELASILLMPETATVEIGSTQSFTATGYDQYGDLLPDVVFAWSSSNETVGTVGADGLFSAAVPGTTVVTASSGSISATAAVTVPLPPPELTTIEVTPSTATVEIGSTQQFSATAYDQYGDVMDDITIGWSSSDEGVGTITSAGLFSAASAGEATITASSGSISGTAVVTVPLPPPELATIEVAPSTATVEIGSTQQFSATAYDQYGDVMACITIAWSSSDETVGTITEGGLFSAASAGEATVTATSGSVSGTAVVTVPLPPPELATIEVLPADATVEIGATQSYSATGYDQYGEPMPDITVSWACSDTAVGTINKKGLFSADAAGTATITATAGSITGQTGVTVPLPPSELTTIEVTPASAEVAIGETQQFTATGYDQYSAVMTGVTFTWSSSDESVGSITSGGLFSASAAGSTTVTATSGLISDGASVTVPLPAPVLTSIAVSPSSATVGIGETQQFTATGYDQYGDVMAGATFTWSSSDESVGTVTSDGLFSASEAGSTTITASSGFISDIASVTVPLAAPVLTSIAVSPSTATVEIGETQQFTATGYDQYGDVMTGVTFIWSSSDEGVGSITSAGLFSASAAGSTTITASSGFISDIASVTVPLPAPVLTSIAVSPSTATVEIGETQQFTATGYDQYGDVMAGATFVWSSSDEGVGSITSAGLFSASAAGSTTITASSGFISDSGSVIVPLPAPVLTSIAVSPSTATVEIGETQQFTATGYDQYGDPMAGIVFIWSSSDESVGSITSGGLFSASAAGSTTITASSGLISDIASVTVPLPAPVLTSIAVSPSTATVAIGETQQFAAIGYDQYDAVMEGVTFVWSSSDKSVGGITSDGLFSAATSGTTTVTATSGLVSDDASVTVPLPAPVLTSIVVSPSTVTVEIGETQQFTATGYDQYDDAMAGIVFTWSSSDESVGSITSSGLFSASAAGSTTIKASSGLISDSASVTVPLPAPVLTSIVVSPFTATVEIGETRQFTATGYDQYGDVMAGATFTWSSSDESVGTVTSYGLFSASEAGSTTITASSGFISDSASVTVPLPAPVLTSIAVSPSTATVEIGETQQFTATGYDQYGDVMAGATFVWSSSDEGVGSITSDGLFSASAAGSTTITASSGLISDSASVTVPLPAPVLTSIAVSPSTATVEIGETQQFTATGYDQYGDAMAGVTFVWSSSDEDVGTITSGGLFSASAAGSTTITASSGLISDSVSVTVPLPAPVLTSIAVSPSTATVEIGETQQFTATGYDQYGDAMAGATFTWSSSDEGVGTVTSDGLFSAATGGTTTITATSGLIAGDATATVALPLPAPELTRIEVLPATSTVAIGAREQFSAIAYDQYDAVMEDLIVTWSVSDAAVGTISPTGLFTAASPGSATITAMNNAVSGSAVVAVPATDTPLEATIALKEYVISLGLHHGTEQALTVKLDAAIGCLEFQTGSEDSGTMKGMSEEEAVNLAGSHLSAFINQVEALEGKKIPQEDAGSLITMAQKILDALADG
ncbi:hypothetical protein AZH53_09605 [Methanomicrobiaceae archaeon CYW5]|nr:hypothetical protein [Methanovulcanius yangii]